MCFVGGGGIGDGDVDREDADLTDKMSPICLLLASLLSSFPFILLVDGSFCCTTTEEEEEEEEEVNK